jgi:hypothetical protein
MSQAAAGTGISATKKKLLYQISEHSILYSFLSSYLHPNEKITFPQFINLSVLSIPGDLSRVAIF